ncbi:MAG: ribonuclease III [Deltaproteobacteria bacterium]|nr:ribonuclease III [Deltaproteobacteria bacterium]
MPELNLDPDLNRPPDGFVPGPGVSVHLIGVGGVAMAALAGLLAEAGCRVSGSDLDLYPPASDLLESLGIKPLRGYGPETLDGGPDLVVVGNVVTRAFPVVARLKGLGLNYMSLPQVLGEFFLSQSRNFVVAGCHGKTTLTNLLALLLADGGVPSGRFVGGASLDFAVPWRAAPPGGVMAIEGDEYDCAFFDKNPKFLHYRPQTVILTSVDYDHADIYPTPQKAKEAYLRLMALLPPDGLVIHNGDDPEVTAVAETAPCRRLSYGTKPGLDAVVENFAPQGLKVKFNLTGPGLSLAADNSPGGVKSLAISLPKPGLHNALNASAAVLAFLAAGGRPAKVAPILKEAKGVRRRQEVILDRDSVTLIDDFAHHPAAVTGTLKALRAGYPGRRILAAFEPRSNTSRRAVFQKAYAQSLRLANVVFLSAVDNPEKAPPGDRLDVFRLAAEVGQSLYYGGPGSLADDLLGEVKSGDIVVVMSNGDFGGLAEKLRSRLEVYLEEGRFTDSWLCSCSCCPEGPTLAIQPRTDLPPGQIAGYEFKNPALLEAALTHRSILGAKPCQAPGTAGCPPAGQDPAGQDPAESPPVPETDNQRLEFLGDSVLNLVVAELLFKSENRRNEGEMTRQRACLVCESRLAEVARALDLGFRLTMAPGEECSGGRERPSVLADAMEAVLGAVYLDGGHEVVLRMVEKLWGAYVDGSFPQIVDHKSRLQEFTQRLKLGQPNYVLEAVSGPSHNQTFTMGVEIATFKSSATGTTKKMAGQRAARELYRLLIERYPDRAE